MKKKLLFFLLIMPLFLNAIYIVEPTSGPYHPGTLIGFRVSQPIGYTVTWNWGDGTTSSGNDTNVFYHTYYNPGTFTISTSWNVTHLPEYYTITIDENRSISYSPSIIRINQEVTFTAQNFNTPKNLTWDFGDGTVRPNQSSSVKYTYLKSGTFTVKVYDFNGNQNYSPVTATIVVNLAQRQITYTPSAPREEQLITFYAENFLSSSVNWDFGDGTIKNNQGTTITHRFYKSGTYTVKAIEANLKDLAAVVISVRVSSDNRFIRLSKNEINPNENLRIEARNFYGQSVLWNFGDGTRLTSTRVVYHSYKVPGIYKISAIDEGGASLRTFTTTIRVLGISDQVNLLLAELQFDNGKYYRVVNLNDKNFYARLRIKARGTGLISGYWLIDGIPFAPFSEMAYQGEVKEITTRNLQIPSSVTGLHTLEIAFNKPWQEGVVTPVLKYFVTAQKPLLEIIAPADGKIFKAEDTIAISWKKFSAASRYEIAFSPTQFSFFENNRLNWLNCKLLTEYQITENIIKSFPPNQWIHFQVRALDSFGKVLAASDIQEFKIVSAAVEISLLEISDFNEAKTVHASRQIISSSDELLLKGQIKYSASTPYLILTIFYNNRLSDRLIFRNVKPQQMLEFESSLSQIEKGGQLVLQLTSSASPAQIVATEYYDIIKNE